MPNAEDLLLKDLGWLDRIETPFEATAWLSRIRWVIEAHGLDASKLGMTDADLIKMRNAHFLRLGVKLLNELATTQQWPRLLEFNFCRIVRKDIIGLHQLNLTEQSLQELMEDAWWRYTLQQIEELEAEYEKDKNYQLLDDRMMDYRVALHYSGRTYDDLPKRHREIIDRIDQYLGENYPDEESIA